ncbi:MAG: hypothetical protein HC843_04600 [Sphingomonadales bacterium]|nr:hypothetical protein [Sphingomonadales bacterium]
MTNEDNISATEQRGGVNRADVKALRQLTIRIPANVIDYLDEVASRLGITRAQAAREVMTSYILHMQAMERDRRSFERLIEIVEYNHATNVYRNQLDFDQEGLQKIYDMTVENVDKKHPRIDGGKVVG